MSQVTLGDIYAAAERHFDAAEQARAEITRTGLTAHELHRLVTAAARSLGDHAPHAVEAAAGTEVSAWQRAAAQLQEALRQAAEQIGQARENPGEPGEPQPDRCTRHLAHAADALLAGLDLLRSHTAVGPGGIHTSLSEWALLMTSQPVISAMTREMSRWSYRAGTMAHWLASDSGQASNAAHAALARAGTLLCAADGIIAPAMIGDPGSASDRDLLLGIPHASPPERRPPRDPETPAQLHTGITTSAARLRSEAFALPADATTSAAVSGPAWQRAARAGAIVSDIASLTLHGLAMRATRLTGYLADPHRLAAAAIALADARNAWEQAAGVWKIMTTDTQSPVNSVTVEASDLVIRMGRLAFDNPQWTPARRHRAPSLAPEVLAPDPGSLTVVLDSAHQAVDALARMADSDLLTIGAVSAAGRLYMPRNVLRGTLGPAHGHVTAPSDRVLLLQDLYRVIVRSTSRAAQELGAMVIDAAAPSRVIALARATELGSAPTPHTDPSLTLDSLQPRIRAFGKPLNWQVTRLDEIDADAVVRAYRDNHRTLRECATQFATSERLITIILRDNDIPIHRTQPTPPPAEANQARPPAASPAPEPDAPARRLRCGPVERHLLALNVTDPGLLLRAAALDRASRELLAEGAASVATQHYPASRHEPQRGYANRAPLVAASDAPPSSGAAIKQQADPLEQELIGSRSASQTNARKRSPARRRALRTVRRERRMPIRFTAQGTTALDVHLLAVLIRPGSPMPPSGLATYRHNGGPVAQWACSGVASRQISASRRMASATSATTMATELTSRSSPSTAS